MSEHRRQYEAMRLQEICKVTCGTEEGAAECLACEIRDYLRSVCDRSDVNIFRTFRMNEGVLSRKQCIAKRYTWYDDYTSYEVAHVVVEWHPGGWTSINDLEVDEDLRGCGIGGQIMRFLVAMGVNHLSVEPTNGTAIRLYERHGFRITGEKEGNLLRMERVTKG